MQPPTANYNRETQRLGKKKSFQFDELFFFYISFTYEKTHVDNRKDTAKDHISRGHFSSYT